LAFSGKDYTTFNTYYQLLRIHFLVSHGNC